MATDNRGSSSFNQVRYLLSFSKQTGTHLYREELS